MTGQEHKLNVGQGQARRASIRVKPAARPEASRTAAWTPQDHSLSGELWQAQAQKLVEFAAGKLSAGDREFLAMRGLKEQTIIESRIGFWPADWYQSRPSWGLPEKIDRGQKRDLWIPAGIVIPHFIGAKVGRVRIRRYYGDPRYYILPGSSMAAMVLNAQQIMVVVESELDALLICQECHGLAGSVAMGSAQARPDTQADDALKQSSLILIALDHDKAGVKEAWQWWPQHYPQAKRWPPIAGSKDPGEMVQAGVNLREWIEAGVEYYGRH